MGDTAQKKIYTEADYENWSGDERVELINGQILMMAPPSTVHQRISAFLSNEIYNYLKSKKKNGPCEVFTAPFDVRLEMENRSAARVQPDISVICDPSKLTERGYNGSPEMVIEITSPSNASRDYITKADLYQRAKVREYWIVNPESKSISIYKLDQDGEYNQIRQYTFQDTVGAGVIAGLEIDFSRIEV
jgi:Uma2 family endonuclease